MTFKKEAIEAFLELFEENKNKIRSSEGCEHLELWQDISDPRIFFTYSHWQAAQYLEQYRQSDLFAEVWAETKVLFDGKPEAWSVELKAEGEQL